MDLECLRLVLQQQQGQFERLQSEVVAYRRELVALCNCLVATGALSRTKLLVEQHRSNFAAMRAAHPWLPETRLEHVLGREEIAVALGAYAGMAVGHAAAAASHSTSRAAADIMAKLYPNYIYICGGYDGAQASCAVERFCPASTVWRPMPPMSEPRQHGAAAVIRGRLYACGGWDGRQALNSCERFDPLVGTWEQLPSMFDRRDGASAAAAGGRLYVCGGRDSTELSSVARYDPDTSIWDALPPMLERRSRAVAKSIAGRLYVCGGEVGARNLSSLEQFDCTRERRFGEHGLPLYGYGFVHGLWEPSTPMLERRAAAAAAVISGKLFVCGGWCDSQTLDSVECFDPQTVGWHALKSMGEKRDGATAAAVAGRLYIFGGLDGWRCLSSVECFDTSIGAWTVLTPMQRGQVHAMAAVLSG